MHLRNQPIGNELRAKNSLHVAWNCAQRKRSLSPMRRRRDQIEIPRPHAAASLVGSKAFNQRPAGNPAIALAFDDVADVAGADDGAVDRAADVVDYHHDIQFLRGGFLRVPSENLQSNCCQSFAKAETLSWFKRLIGIRLEVFRW